LVYCRPYFAPETSEAPHDYDGDEDPDPGSGNGGEAANKAELGCYEIAGLTDCTQKAKEQPAAVLLVLDHCFTGLFFSDYPTDCGYSDEDADQFHRFNRFSQENPGQKGADYRRGGHH
jgi:hypothetical protein